MLILNSCGYKRIIETFETELGDNLCLEVSLRGNLHGMYPRYQHQIPMILNCLARMMQVL